MYWKKHGIRATVIIILILLITLQIRHQQILSRSNEFLATGRVGLPSSGLSENDTHDRVPGNPGETMTKAAVIFKNVETYRRFHQGKYPSSAAEMISDAMNNFKQYGQRSSQDTLRLYESDDNRYSDDPRKRSSASVIPWVICAERPDGEAFGGPKLPGTRDVVSYTSLYYHEQIRRFNGYRDTVHPVGFYIVVWDDGEVQQIPYQDVLYVRKPGTKRRYIGFPGEAGVPKTAFTYNQEYKGIQRQK